MCKFTFAVTHGFPKRYVYKPATFFCAQRTTLHHPSTRPHLATFRPSRRWSMDLRQNLQETIVFFTHTRDFRSCDGLNVQPQGPKRPQISHCVWTIIQILAGSSYFLSEKNPTVSWTKPTYSMSRFKKPTIRRRPWFTGKPIGNDFTPPLLHRARCSSEPPGSPWDIQRFWKLKGI